jgi:predicted nucleic acid-binding protein
MSGLAKPSFVLDTSISAAWVLDSQITPYKQQVLQALTREMALVPALWHIEMSNMLCKYARKNNLSMAQLEPHLASLASLPITTFEWTLTKAAQKKMGAMRKMTQLAIAQGLSSYDAQYLHLAIHTGLPLASCDAQLCASALEAGVAIYQP